MDPQQSHQNDSGLQSPQAQYIVLRVSDITASAQFFSVLGFNPVKEQHGDGPEHFSFCIHGELVCELYPWGRETSAPTNFARFGLLVSSLSETKERLLAAQIKVIRESATGATRKTMIVLDPDGNQVELFDQLDIG
jgi:lactoylglutathione lyase